MNFSSGSTSGLGLPSFLPLTISKLELYWPDLADDPTNFQIDLSASVSGKIGPISLNGSVSDMVIDVGKLLKGQFPITDIGSVLVTASGNVFGGQLGGALILGLVKLKDGARIPPGIGNITPDQTILYVGIEGGFVFASKAGFEIRFGVSQNGPLDIYIQADVPIPVVPQVGLALDDFAGDVTFNATPFPTITNAKDLDRAAFTPSTMETDAQWLTSLQQDVVNQAGASGGFAFAIPSLPTTAAEFSDLAKPAVVDGSTLQNDFLAQSLNLPAGATITQQPGGTEWLIVSGHTQYLLTYVNGQLNVYSQTFSLDSSLATDLNSGAVTAALTTAFQNAGVVLSSSATVVRNSGSGPANWTITDGNFKYLVQTIGSVLSVVASGGSMNETQQRHQDRGKLLHHRPGHAGIFPGHRRCDHRNRRQDSHDREPRSSAIPTAAPPRPCSSTSSFTSICPRSPRARRRSCSTTNRT